MRSLSRVSVVSVPGDVQSRRCGEDPADESESRRRKAFAARTVRRAPRSVRGLRRSLPGVTLRV